MKGEQRRHGSKSRNECSVRAHYSRGCHTFPIVNKNDTPGQWGKMDRTFQRILPFLSTVVSNFWISHFIFLRPVKQPSVETSVYRTYRSLKWELLSGCRPNLTFILGDSFNFSALCVHNCFAFPLSRFQQWRGENFIVVTVMLQLMNFSNFKMC